VSDNIHLTGTGAAVVTASGSATVIGGAGKLTFTGAAGAKDSVVAGAGGGTLTGGSKASGVFVGGRGAGKFVPGVGGKDNFVGGPKSDTMVGAGTDKVGTDLFQFASSLKGGTHTIQSFTSGRDTIDLVGYTKAQITAAITAGAKTYKNGTETITLTD